MKELVEELEQRAAEARAKIDEYSGNRSKLMKEFSSCPEYCQPAHDELQTLIFAYGQIIDGYLSILENVNNTLTNLLSDEYIWHMIYNEDFPG